MNREISDKDLQQLSTYLDGRLPEKERVQVEARLQSQPELQDELEGLRRTQILLRHAPKRRAPRNFFITPAMTPKRPPLRLFPVFRLASALAGLLLVVAFAGDLLFGFAPQSAAPFTLQSEPRSANGSSEVNPLVLTWGTPTPGGVVTGLGGGYGGGPATGMGGGPASSDMLPPTVSADNSTPTAPAPESTTKASLVLPPTLAPTQEAETPPSLLSAAPLNPQSTPAQPANDQSAYQSGPVLGINPVEGAAEATQVAVLNQTQSQPIALPRPTLHIVEGVLAVLGVVAGLAAFFFHRREI